MQGLEVFLVFFFQAFEGFTVAAVGQLPGAIRLEAQTRLVEGLGFLRGAGAGRLKLGNRLVVLADSLQDHAKLKVQGPVFRVQVHPPAERLDLVLVEHLGQLVELDLGSRVVGPFADDLGLFLDRTFQAADLGVLESGQKDRIAGVGLDAFGQHFLGLIQVAALPIEVGQVEIGVNRLGVAQNVLDEPLLGRELLLFEPIELGVERLAGLDRGLGVAVERVLQSGALDRRAAADSALICRLAS